MAAGPVLGGAPPRSAANAQRRLAAGRRSGDPRLCALLAASDAGGDDPFRALYASWCRGQDGEDMAVEDVSDAQRQQAKGLFYGLLYGMGENPPRCVPLARPLGCGACPQGEDGWAGTPAAASRPGCVARVAVLAR